ncbi:MAG: hypothetical protein Q7S95_01000 [bacterium]|nr:hypothetical protein [bacterium]
MEVLETFAPVGTFITSNAVSSWDVVSGFLIVIVPALILFYIGWYIGRGQLVAILLALYAAYALYIAFPYTGILPSAPPITALATRLVLYLGLVFLFYIILRRVVVSDFLYIGMIGLMLLCVLGAAFLVALAYHVFPVTELYHFNPALDPFFGPKQFFFWWFAGPAVGLFFFAK